MWLFARKLTRFLFQCDAREHMEKGFPQMDEISLWKFEKRSGQGNRRKDGPQQYIGKEGGSMPAGMPSKACCRGKSGATFGSAVPMLENALPFYNILRIEKWEMPGALLQKGAPRAFPFGNGYMQSLICACTWKGRWPQRQR